FRDGAGDAGVPGIEPAPGGGDELGELHGHRDGNAGETRGGGDELSFDRERPEQAGDGGGNDGVEAVIEDPLETVLSRRGEVAEKDRQRWQGEADVGKDGAGVTEQGRSDQRAAAERAPTGAGSDENQQDGGGREAGDE